MRLISLSNRGDAYLAQIDYFRTVNNKYIRLDLDRMDTCDFEVILITKDPMDINRLSHPGVDQNILFELHDAWVGMCHEESQDKILDAQLMQIINQNSLPLINREHEKNFLVRQCKKNKHNPIAYLFLGEHTWFPLESLFMLSRVCKIAQGSFPLHVSAVLFHDDLYLFGGLSGAGKSTIANILQDQGGVILDEDQVIVRKVQEGSYTASAWGYSLTPCSAPIRAIFQLVKDDHNAVEPLSITQGASFIMTQADQVAGWMLYENLYKQLFSLTSAFARSVPVHKLHFTLDGNFWPLILEGLSEQSS